MAGPEIPDGVVVPDEVELPRTGIDRHRVDDELYQHVPENPSDWAQYRMAEDGLPTVQAPTKMPFAPPLTPETLCCLADTSRFVLRDRWRTVVAEFGPDDVERTPDGSYRVRGNVAWMAVSARCWLDAGGAKPGETWLDFVARRTRSGLRAFARFHACPAVLSGTWLEDWIEVEPLRPQCQHFARQLTDFQDETEHLFMARLCTARRDEGGEFLSLRDSQMLACELREPMDAPGRERVDTFDAAKIALGRRRLENGDGFDVDQALADMTQTDEEAGESAGGIFKPTS